MSREVAGSRELRESTSLIPDESSDELGSYAGGPLDTSRDIREVEVVPELCQNFLNCMRIAKGAFKTHPTNRRTVPARWQQVDLTRLWKAALSCPSGAIRFTTSKGYVSPRWEEAVLWSTDRHPAAGRRSTGEAAR